MVVVTGAGKLGCGSQKIKIVQNSDFVFKPERPQFTIRNKLPEPGPLTSPILMLI